MALFDQFLVLIMVCWIGQHVDGAVQVSITSEGNPTLGQQYSLTCEVSVSSGDTGTLTVQWMRAGSSEPITNGGDFTVTSTSATVYMLVINPLRQFHAGQYTCMASVGGDTGTDSVIVNIAVPTIRVEASIITPATTSFIAGQSYNFSCDGFVTVDGTLSTITTITWIRPNGSMTSGTGRALGLTFNPLQESDAGQYTCNVSVSSPLLAGAHTSTDTFTISVLSPTYPSVTRVVSSFSFPPPTVGNGVVSAYSLSDITAAIIVGMVSGALTINA